MCTSLHLLNMGDHCTKEIKESWYGEGCFQGEQENVTPRKIGPEAKEEADGMFRV